MNSFSNSDQNDFDQLAAASTKISRGINNVHNDLSETNGLIKSGFASAGAVLSTIKSGVQNVGQGIANVYNRNKEDYGINTQEFSRRVAAMAGGPIGVAVRDVIANSGINVGNIVKKSIGGIANVFHGHNDKGTRLLDDDLNQLSTLNNRQLRAENEQVEQLKNTNKILGDLRNIASATPKVNKIGGSHITQKSTSSTRDPHSGAIIGGSSNSPSNSPSEVLDLLRQIAENQTGLKNIFTDPEGKEEPGIFKTIVKEMISMPFGFKYWFSGRYAKDIKRDNNPLTTIVNALIKMYEWERIGIDLSRRQLNELIKASGGQTQKYIGHEGSMVSAVKRTSGAIKRGAVKTFGNNTLGRMIGGALTLPISLLRFGEQDFEDQQYLKAYSVATGMGKSRQKGFKGLLKNLTGGDKDLNRILYSEKNIRNALDTLVGGDFDDSEFKSVLDNFKNRKDKEDDRKIERLLADKDLKEWVKQLNDWKNSSDDVDDIKVKLYIKDLKNLIGEKLDDYGLNGIHGRRVNLSDITKIKKLEGLRGLDKNISVGDLFGDLDTSKSRIKEDREYVYELQKILNDPNVTRSKKMSAFQDLENLKNSIENGSISFDDNAYTDTRTGGSGKKHTVIPVVPVGLTPKLIQQVIQDNPGIITRSNFPKNLSGGILGGLGEVAGIGADKDAKWDGSESVAEITANSNKENAKQNRRQTEVLELIYKLQKDQNKILSEAKVGGIKGLFNGPGGILGGLSNIGGSLLGGMTNLIGSIGSGLIHSILNHPLLATIIGAGVYQGLKGWFNDKNGKKESDGTPGALEAGLNTVLNNPGLTLETGAKSAVQLTTGTVGAVASKIPFIGKHLAPAAQKIGSAINSVYDVSKGIYQINNDYTDPSGWRNIGKGLTVDWRHPWTGIMAPFANKYIQEKFTGSTQIKDDQGNIITDIDSSKSAINLGEEFENTAYEISNAGSSINQIKQGLSAKKSQQIAEFTTNRLKQLDAAYNKTKRSLSASKAALTRATKSGAGNIEQLTQVVQNKEKALRSIENLRKSTQAENVKAVNATGAKPNFTGKLVGSLGDAAFSIEAGMEARKYFGDDEYLLGTLQASRAVLHGAAAISVWLGAPGVVVAGVCRLLSLAIEAGIFIITFYKNKEERQNIIWSKRMTIDMDFWTEDDGANKKTIENITKKYNDNVKKILTSLSLEEEEKEKEVKRFKKDFLTQILDVYKKWYNSKGKIRRFVNEQGNKNKEFKIQCKDALITLYQACAKLELDNSMTNILIGKLYMKWSKNRKIDSSTTPSIDLDLVSEGYSWRDSGDYNDYEERLNAINNSGYTKETKSALIHDLKTQTKENQIKWLDSDKEESQRRARYARETGVIEDTRGLWATLTGQDDHVNQVELEELKTAFSKPYTDKSNPNFKLLEKMSNSGYDVLPDLKLNTWIDYGVKEADFSEFISENLPKYQEKVIKKNRDIFKHSVVESKYSKDINSNIPIKLMPESARIQIQFILDDKNYNSEEKTKFIEKYSQNTKEFWITENGLKAISDTLKKNNGSLSRDQIMYLIKGYFGNVSKNTVAFKSSNLYTTFGFRLFISRLCNELLKDCKTLLKNYLSYYVSSDYFINNVKTPFTDEIDNKYTENTSYNVKDRINVLKGYEINKESTSDLSDIFKNLNDERPAYEDVVSWKDAVKSSEGKTSNIDYNKYVDKRISTAFETLGFLNNPAYTKFLLQISKDEIKDIVNDKSLTIDEMAQKLLNLKTEIDSKFFNDKSADELMANYQAEVDKITNAETLSKAYGDTDSKQDLFEDADYITGFLDDGTPIKIRKTDTILLNQRLSGFTASGKPFEVSEKGPEIISNGVVIPIGDNPEAKIAQDRMNRVESDFMHFDTGGGATNQKEYANAANTARQFIADGKEQIAALKTSIEQNGILSTLKDITKKGFDKAGKFYDETKKFIDSKGGIIELLKDGFKNAGDYFQNMTDTFLEDDEFMSGAIGNAGVELGKLSAQPESEESKKFLSEAGLKSWDEFNKLNNEEKYKILKKSSKFGTAIRKSLDSKMESYTTSKDLTDEQAEVRALTEVLNEHKAEKVKQITADKLGDLGNRKFEDLSDEEKIFLAFKNSKTYQELPASERPKSYQDMSKKDTVLKVLGLNKEFETTVNRIKHNRDENKRTSRI